MNNQPVYRSRLVKQENKRIVRQTILIVTGTLAFLIFFLVIGFPALIKLAINLGNAKSTSILSVQEDKLPPLPPQLNPLPEATTSATITVSGNAEPGTVVHLFLNSNKLAENTADNQGAFVFSDVRLDEGANHFIATATDTAGNQSQQSPPQTIVVDDKPPELTISAPSDGAKINGILNQLIDVSGSTDAESQVTLNGRQLVVTGDGSFTTKYQLQEGDNQLKFTAIDPAGNKTETEIKVNFSR